MKTDRTIRPGGDLTAVKLVEKHLGASGIPPSKSRRASHRVAAAATGSLPVLSAEALCCEWEEKACDYQRLSGPCDEAGKIKFTAIADTFWACAAGLRRQMEATTERQPEENVKVSDRADNAHSTAERTQ